MRRLPYDPGTFDLRDFCEQLLGDHEEKERVRFQCDAGAFSIVADPLRLREAVGNLLSNALKYSDSLVLVSLSATENGYRIQVQDRGIGIPPEDQTSLFEPFFRGSNTVDRPGHGLGLCVARSCVEQQGGTIRFRSDSREGTTFTVDLPASSPMNSADGKENPGQAIPDSLAERTQRTAAGGAALSDSAELTGILVDDDPLVRSVLRDLLENSKQIEILGEAGSVGQARLLVRKHVPAVVFLDVNLPDGSGFDLLPDLGEKTQVVFVTSAEDYGAHAFDCEATDYLLKPVDSARLLKTLRRVRERVASKSNAQPPGQDRPPESFLISTLSGKKMVKVGQIKSLFAYGEYSRVYWQNEPRGALLRKSLKQWECELPSPQFVRVHRHAIVNLAFLDRIEKLAGGRIQLHLREGTEPILVSLRMAADLSRKLKQFGR